MNYERLAKEQITVIIPTHRRIPVGLREFTEQAKEVLILENGGLNFEIGVENIRIKRVPWEGHGQTRQNGLAFVQSNFVFFSVDDAIPLKGMLPNLLSIIQKKHCDAVIPRQIPHPRASSITRQALERWTPNAEQPYLIDQADHVGTLYRVETLQKYPIPAVPIAEDAWWSLGKTILCHPKAQIQHSHPRHSRELFVRELQIHRELRKMGKNKPQFSLRAECGAVLNNGLQHSWREFSRTGLEFLARRIAWF